MTAMRGRLWLILAVISAITTWVYAHRIQGPWRYQHNVELGTLKAEWGDLYSPWTGTKELLLHGRNPYSTEVSSEIQVAFYGHAIHQDYDREKHPVVDEQRFAYPVYAVFILAPTA